MIKQKFHMAKLLFCLSVLAVGYHVSSADVSAKPRHVAKKKKADDYHGWKKVKFPGIKANKFQISEQGQIDVKMDKSSGLIYRPLNDQEQISQTLKWQWKVDQNFPATPLSEKDIDDRPVAVHIWFPDEKGAKKEGGFTRLVGRLLGYEFPGRVLTYVWGGTEQAGDVIANPHFEDKGYFIILKPGAYENPNWVSEQVDFRKDFERIFQKKAPNPTHIAISGDSDNSGVMAASSVRMIMAGPVKTSFYQVNDAEN